MVATLRPDVPWGEVRSRIMKGETGAAIAADLETRGIKISRQAINQRAQRESWPRSFEPAEVQKVESSFPNRLPTTWDAEKVSEFLENVASGVSIEVAAAAAGLNAKTIEGWRAENPELEDLVRQARSKRALKRLGNIEKRGDEGDWRASAWLAERDPLTREQFGPNGSSGAQINVTINVPRDDQVTIQGKSE